MARVPQIHVFPGDAVADVYRQLGRTDEIIVCRECFVDGDVSGRSQEDFWRRRMSFISETFGESPEVSAYKVRGQFEKLATEEREVNLWFGNELFCQVNYWFCLSLLQHRERGVYRVAPIAATPDQRWNCISAADFDASFAERTELSPEDLKFGDDLWNAFRHNDKDKLFRLSETVSPAFSFLKDIVHAAISREERIPAILRDLKKQGFTEFPSILSEFSRIAPVYGFGDAQVRRWLERI